MTLALSAAALLGCSHDRSKTAQVDEAPLADSPAAGSAGFGLFYNDQGESVSLAYGQANSDNVSLMLECAKGSGRVQVSDIARTNRTDLVLASGDETRALPARVEAADGPPLLVADTTADAPALRAFRRTGALTVGDGRAAYAVKASAPERTEVDLFFTACGTAA
jgi:hypothetical protein